MTLPSEEELKITPTTDDIRDTAGLGETTIINNSCSWISEDNDADLTQSQKYHSNKKV